MRRLQPGYLAAYAASDFADGKFRALWSNLGAEPESVRNFAKMTQPLIANGRVYLPTLSGEVTVYGLR